LRYDIHIYVLRRLKVKLRNPVAKCVEWSADIASYCTGCFIMSFVIPNIYNKKTKGPTLMELFTATGKLKKFF
jgi:hypothetical protein